MSDRPPFHSQHAAPIREVQDSILGIVSDLLRHDWGRRLSPEHVRRLESVIDRMSIEDLGRALKPLFGTFANPRDSTVYWCIVDAVDFFRTATDPAWPYTSDHRRLAQLEISNALLSTARSEAIY